MKEVYKQVCNQVVYELPMRIVSQLIQDREVVLAGGFIRSVYLCEKPQDIDVFCKNREKALELVEQHFPSSYTETRCAFSVQCEKFKIQYVFYSLFKNAEDLIQQFDFKMCSAAIWYENGWQSVCLDDWEEEVKARTLTFMARDKDKGSLVPLRRALNFTERGWKISDTELAKIVHHFNPTVSHQTVRSSFTYGYNQATQNTDRSQADSGI